MLLTWKILVSDIDIPKNMTVPVPVANGNKSTTSSFVALLRKHSWGAYKEHNDIEKIQVAAAVKYLFPDLLKFITKPHIAPINASCKPPLLQIPSNVNCTKLPLPRKVGVLLQFGFDVDALEIHLNELDEVVDKFFIVESIEAHNIYVGGKPLIWDLIKSDDRFVKFSSKIVHFVVDDASISKRNKNVNVSLFDQESHQEEQRWLRFLEWNDATKYFSGSDILGLGDVDEIPHRDNIFFLKNCELEHEQIDIGIGFPYGILNSVFFTDFPVPGHPTTLGDPTYWTLRRALEYFHEAEGKYPNRMRGQSPAFLLGGIHLSDLLYPAMEIVKYFTQTEINFNELISALQYYSSKNSTHVVTPFVYIPDSLKDRVRNLDDFELSDREQAEIDATLKLPWFYNCNRKRYPYIEGEHDRRLD